MELTEDMLRRIATNIGDLRLRLNLVQQMLTRQGTNFEEFENMVNRAVEAPEFREFCNHILEQLKGGH